MTVALNTPGLHPSRDSVLGQPENTEEVGPAGTSRAIPGQSYTREGRPTCTRSKELSKESPKCTRPSNSTTQAIYIYFRTCSGPKKTHLWIAPRPSALFSAEEGRFQRHGRATGSKTQAINSQQDLCNSRPCILKMIFWSLEAEQTFLQLYFCSSFSGPYSTSFYQPNWEKILSPPITQRP